jgi:hypothetical protein
MNIEHKNAVGTFPNFQEIELALRQLKATGFHMNNVSVVAEHLDSASDILARSTDSTIQSEDGFVWGNRHCLARHISNRLVRRKPDDSNSHRPRYTDS